MILRARVFGAKKIILATNHPSSKTLPFEHLKSISYNESNVQYNKIIRKVAENQKVILIDHEKEWIKKIKINQKLNDFLLPDQIHLSEKGHELYFNFALPILMKLL